ncbi:MAG: ABC transporter ATP-binding protein [Candidatus Hodarchaeota archaeon]
MGEVVKIQNLSKYYDSIKALDKVIQLVQKGSIFGYLGPNGAGKTTTLKILMGLLHYQSGLVRIFGQEVKNASPSLHQRIGFLPDAELPKSSSIKRFLNINARMNEISQYNLRVNEVLVQFGLKRLRNRKIGSLSKGQKQRVGLANALLADPPLLILDEPNSGLDPITRVKALTILKDLSKEGKTIILSSHIINEIDKVATDIAIIHRGRILEQGKRSDLQKKFLAHGMYIVAGKIDINSILTFNCINSCEKNFQERYIIRITGGISEERLLFDLIEANSKIKYFSSADTSLEDLFLEKVNSWKDGAAT